MEKKLLLNWDTVVVRILIYDWPYKKSKDKEYQATLREVLQLYADNPMHPITYVQTAIEFLKQKTVGPHMVMGAGKSVLAEAVKHAITVHKSQYPGTCLDMKLIDFRWAEYHDFIYDSPPSKPKKDADTRTVRSVSKKRTKRSAS